MLTVSEPAVSLEAFFSGRRTRMFVESYTASHSVLRIGLFGGTEFDDRVELVVFLVESCEFTTTDTPWGEISVRRSAGLLELAGPIFRVKGANAYVQCGKKVIAG